MLSLRSILREADMHVGRNCNAARQILHDLKVVQDDARTKVCSVMSILDSLLLTD